MKILILRFSSIGDIVLTTPVIRTVRTQQADVEIHYATKEAYASMLQENPYIDKTHVLERSLNNLVGELHGEHFDLIIDLHNNLRTRIIKSRLGAKSYSFKKLNWEKWLYTTFKINKLPKIHIVDRYMKTVESLGVKMDNLGLDFFIPEKDEMSLEWLPESHRDGFAALVVGAKFKTKQLPVNRMIELCDRINKPIVLLGGKEDEEIAAELEEFFRKRDSTKEFEEGLDKLGKRTRIFNAVGKCNLNQSASLIKQSNWVFSHDTGLMHIAAAFKKPVFSIWGNTIPAFGMYPFRTQFTIFENNELNCRPCSKIGYKQCPKGHFKCMNDLVFDFYLGE
ncbi:MAG: glycosyltransferase family 9 protein [Cytophagales bacterium]|nr:glycosyltransferase family 9 protein [Cytophagales bacterium]